VILPEERSNRGTLVLAPVQIMIDRRDESRLCLVANASLVERFRKRGEPFQHIAPEFDRPLGDRTKLLVQPLDRLLEVHLT
jgi:hypothetical protein